MKWIFYCLLFLVLTSCARSDEEKCQIAKEDAKYYLTKKRCSSALKAIQGSCSSSDAQAVALESSSYACFANFSELSVIDQDLDNLNVNSVISSLASLDSSDEVEADSPRYQALQAAIYKILNSTSSVSASNRRSRFGSVKSIDLNFQALFMLITQIGRYFAYYGNADTDGIKGNGTQANNCLLSYTHSQAANWVTLGFTGNCVSANNGSADLRAPVSTQDIKRRSCEGIILFNNLMDILGNINLSGSIYGNLSQIKSAIDLLYDAAMIAENNQYTTVTIATTKEVLSMSECMDLSQEAIDKYFDIFFETNYQ